MRVLELERMLVQTPLSLLPGRQRFLRGRHVLPWPWHKIVRWEISYPKPYCPPSEDVGIQGKQLRRCCSKVDPIADLSGIACMPGKWPCKLALWIQVKVNGVLKHTRFAIEPPRLCENRTIGHSRNYNIKQQSAWPSRIIDPFNSYIFISID